MRDPLDDKKTAFEFLESTMNVPRSKVPIIYGEYVRKHRDKMREANDKRSILMDYEKRLLQDIYLYSLIAFDDFEDIPYEYKKPEYILPDIKPGDLGDIIGFFEMAIEKDIEPIMADRELEDPLPINFSDVDNVILPLPLDK